MQSPAQRSSLRGLEGATARKLQENPFSFFQGLPTGGTTTGSALGTGIVDTTIAPTDPTDLADKANGSNLANGFGFGFGSGVSTNNGGETAGAIGGATAFGLGTTAFEIDEAFASNFASQGSTFSLFDSASFVGFDPPNPATFTFP